MYFLKYQEYKKRRNPVLLPKYLCLFENLASWKQMLSTVSLMHFFSCCCLLFVFYFYVGVLDLRHYTCILRLFLIICEFTDVVTTAPYSKGSRVILHEGQTLFYPNKHFTYNCKFLVDYFLVFVIFTVHVVVMIKLQQKHFYVHCVGFFLF